MASNPHDRAAQIAAEEAERLAAQFRPAWEVDDGSEPIDFAEAAPQLPPPTPPPAHALSSDVRQATMRWSPGTVPNAAGLPAPAPPSPPPAPPPVMAAPVAMEQHGPVPQATSSNGEAAVAIATGPKLPPKALDVVVAQEPSIIVAEAGPKDDTRRRETVRLDALKFDPEIAQAQAQRERDARKKEAQSKVARTQRIVREPGKAPALAPMPLATSEDDEVLPPRKNNRAIVIGALAFAGLVMVLGLVKAMAGKSDETATDTTATTSATAAAASTARPQADATATAAAAATEKKPADAAPVRGSRVNSVPANPPPLMAAKDLPAAAPTQQAAPKPAVTDDSASKAPKKPQKGGTGSIVRDAPF